MPKQKLISIYLFITALVVAAVIGILHYGTSLFPSVESTAIADTKPADHTFLQVLIAMITILFATQIVGRILRYVRQPAVIGEMIGGILIGPSVLGQFFPEVKTFLFPETIFPFISKIAQLGVILYMFVVGLDLDLSILKRRAHSIIAVSYGSMVLPLLLGLGISIIFYTDLAPAGISFSSFSLFLGVAMSITAFPVLARILGDLKIHKSEIGSIALSCAAVADVAAWCLLALAVSIAKTRTIEAIQTFAMTLGFIFLMIFVVRPLFLKALPRLERSQNSRLTLTIVLAIALLCSFFTEFIGIHTIFGAFLFGAILSTEKTLVEDITIKFDDLVKILFLPAFFAYSGLRTQLFLISTLKDLEICALITAVAIVGKFGGTYLVSRWVGFEKRTSTILGTLMNTRGLVELIVLNIGLDLGIISPRLFAMMVIMAIVTTLMTSPLTIWLLPKAIAKAA